jgi:Xaa-Pro aminopeptidase
VGGRLADLTTPYQELRFVKSEEELRFIDVASAFNDRAIEALAAELRPGLPEYALAKIIEDTYLAERGTNLIHFTLATSMQDPDRGVPHQYPPDRVLRSGDVFVTEISTLYWGYAGQILRTFTIGTLPTERYAALHEAALAAYDALAGALRAGTTVGEMLDVAEMIHDAGYTIEDDLIHGYSGGYLPPIVRTRRTRGATHPDAFAYPADAIVVVQPNVTTLDGRAGVQVGNSLRVTPDGAVSTQHAPLRLFECAV